jgi:hypothetical protein
VQTKQKSLEEAFVSTCWGFLFSLVISFIAMPMVGYAVTFHQNFLLTCIYTVASVIRQYVVRRWYAKKELQNVG